jgi:hypothetical protein
VSRISRMHDCMMAFMSRVERSAHELTKLLSEFEEV